VCDLTQVLTELAGDISKTRWYLCIRNDLLTQYHVSMQVTCQMTELRHAAEFRKLH